MSIPIEGVGLRFAAVHDRAQGGPRVWTPIENPRVVAILAASGATFHVVCGVTPEGVAGTDDSGDPGQVTSRDPSLEATSPSCP